MVKTAKWHPSPLSPLFVAEDGYYARLFLYDHCWDIAILWTKRKRPSTRHCVNYSIYFTMSGEYLESSKRVRFVHTGPPVQISDLISIYNNQAYFCLARPKKQNQKKTNTVYRFPL